MTLVILMFFAFTLFMWFKIASLNCYLATLITFKSRTNILVCSQQLFLSCFMITLFTFKHSCQGLCGESTQPNNVFSWNMSLTETIKIKLHLNIISAYWAPLFVYLFRSFFITLVTFIFESFMLTLFMQVEIWFLNCFIIALVTFIFYHIMLGLCDFTRAFFRLFIKQVIVISYHVCLYLMCHLNDCYELPW